MTDILVEGTPLCIQLQSLFPNLELVGYRYGGPGSQLVTDRWKVDWSSYLASARDIVVAQIDGRGSAGQGYLLLHQVYHRLGSVEVADQLEVTE